MIRNRKEGRVVEKGKEARVIREHLIRFHTGFVEILHYSIPFNISSYYEFVPAKENYC